MADCLLRAQLLVQEESKEMNWMPTRGWPRGTWLWVLVSQQPWAWKLLYSLPQCHSGRWGGSSGRKRGSRLRSPPETLTALSTLWAEPASAPGHLSGR